jgi:hypothetical protein
MKIFMKLNIMFFSLAICTPALADQLDDMLNHQEPKQQNGGIAERSQAINPEIAFDFRPISITS